MSSFNYLLSRTYLLSEAKGEKGLKNIRQNLPPALGTVFKSASEIAKTKGASSPPREGKKAAISYIIDYVEMKIGDLEIDDIKGLTKFENIGRQELLIDFLETTTPAGSDLTYAEILKSITDADIEAINSNRQRDVTHAVDQSLIQRSDEKKEKYEVNAAAYELKKQEKEQFKQLAQAAKVQGDVELANAMTAISVSSNETMLVMGAVAKILNGILTNLGEPGFDIEDEALNEVLQQSGSLNSLDSLKAYIQQISRIPTKEKIALYLSSAIRPISQQLASTAAPSIQGVEDEEMPSEDAEDGVDDFDLGQSEDLDPGYSEIEDRDLEDLANDLNFTYVLPGPDTYESNLYTIDSLYVSKDGNVFIGKFSDARVPYFVAYEHGRITSWSLEDLYGVVEKILAGRDPKPEDEEAESDNEEIVNVAGYPYQVQFDDSGEVSTVTPSDKDAKINISLVNKYVKSGFPLNRAIAAATSYEDNNLANRGGEDSMMMGESYTSMYLTEQKKINRPNDKLIEQSMSFKEKFKPKTSFQLEELRRYGL